MMLRTLFHPLFSRLFWHRVFVLALATGFLLATGVAFAASPIVAVEEDWELQLANPDPASDAPQVTCVMSTTGDTNGLHATFELNHRTQPDFAPGGMQIQIWNGEDLVTSKSAYEDGLLNHDGEVVRWTQRLSVADGSLTFQVSSGESESWGNFGGNDELKKVVTTTDDSLAGYTPTVSTNDSGVGYAGHRVGKLVLKEVRYYTAEGLASTDSEDKVVHEH